MTLARSNDGYPDRNFNPDVLTEKMFSLYSLSIAQRSKAVPFEIEGNVIRVAVIDANDLSATDDIAFALGNNSTEFYQVDPEFLDAALVRWARHEAAVREGATVAELTPEEIALAVVEDEEESGQISGLVFQLIDQAIDLGASDIHIHPNDVNLAVKFRIDGVLRPHQNYPRSLAPGIINRIKVLSGIGSVDRRTPQDGRFERNSRGRIIDCRTVTLPTAWDIEGATIRLLDRGRSMFTLDDIGFHDHIIDRFKKVLGTPNGLILVTGPTGSGKTTTLYAALGLVATPERNTLAIEDPVEIRFPAITQLQVNTAAELTFATALRSFLRADPDVILVGEIRDDETATLSVQAAQTGHLVLSTLHANDSSSAPTRLSSLGLSPHDMGTSLRGVLAQRLVRRVCSNCAIIGPITPEEKALLGEGSLIAGDVAHANPEGCVRCAKVGYSGRLLVGELLVVDEPMIEAISASAPAHEIRTLALNSGTRTLEDDALEWVRTKDTTIEELSRMGLIE